MPHDDSPPLLEQVKRCTSIANHIRSGTPEASRGTVIALQHGDERRTVEPLVGVIVHRPRSVSWCAVATARLHQSAERMWSQARCGCRRTVDQDDHGFTFT